MLLTVAVKKELKTTTKNVYSQEKNNSTPSNSFFFPIKNEKS